MQATTAFDAVHDSNYQTFVPFYVEVGTECMDLIRQNHYILKLWTIMYMYRSNISVLMTPNINNL